MRRPHFRSRSRHTTTPTHPTTAGHVDAADTPVNHCQHLFDQHWHGDDLHTAMRLLCAPGVLLERHVGDPSEEVLARAEVGP